MGAAMARGIQRACTGVPVTIDIVPLADGGDGTLDLLLEQAGGMTVFAHGRSEPAAVTCWLILAFSHVCF